MKRPLSKSENMFGIILVVLLIIGISVVPLFADAAKPYRVELAENWKLIPSKEVQSEGAMISVATYNDDRWHPVRQMPATVLQILQDDGIYPDLYFGKNLREKVSQDLYKQDWWYRITFDAPVNDFYTLEFPGINYRAEIWLNGNKIADNKQVGGMGSFPPYYMSAWDMLRYYKIPHEIIHYGVTIKIMGPKMLPS